MKNIFLFLLLIISGASFAQLTPVASPTAGVFVSADAKGNLVAALTVDGKLAISNDGGNTFTLSPFTTAAPSYGIFNGSSVSLADNSIYVFGNQVTYGSDKPIVYKVSFTGQIIKKTVLGTTVRLKSGCVINNGAVMSIAYKTAPGGYIQCHDSSLAGLLNYPVRGYYANAITGNSCPGAVEEAPVNLNKGINGLATGVCLNQNRAFYTNEYLGTLPSGALVTVTEGKISPASNAVDYVGAYNVVLTQDGKILTNPGGLCEPYTQLTQAPSTTCKALATNGSKFIVGTNDAVLTYNGTWTTNTTGVAINDVIIVNGVGLAFGNGGKIFKINL